MSLITMGYGHLTVITMGLGNGIRIVRSARMRSQWGTVEFDNVIEAISIRETTPAVTVEEVEEEVKTTAPDTEVEYG